MRPLYTADNCRSAYQLNWSLSVFWVVAPPATEHWWSALKDATEADGVRVLEHRLSSDRTSQFLISTQPETAPPAVARSVKGRLQYLVRDRVPKAFRRHYAIRSVGSTRCAVLDGYICQQTKRHVMADSRVRERVEALRIDGDHGRLDLRRTSGHAQFCYNLHLVLVNAARDAEIRASVLETRRTMIMAVAAKKRHEIGSGQILTDHIHLALRCNLNESPREIALSYLNNLAYAEGMRAIYEFGFYVGTFGEYDLGAVRQHAAAPHAS